MEFEIEMLNPPRRVLMHKAHLNRVRGARIQFRACLRDMVIYRRTNSMHDGVEFIQCCGVVALCHQFMQTMADSERQVSTGQRKSTHKNQGSNYSVVLDWARCKRSHALLRTTLHLSRYRNTEEPEAVLHGRGKRFRKRDFVGRGEVFRSDDLLFGVPTVERSRKLDKIGRDVVRFEFRSRSLHYSRKPVQQSLNYSSLLRSNLNRRLYTNVFCFLKHRFRAHKRVLEIRPRIALK